MACNERHDNRYPKTLFIYNRHMLSMLNDLQDLSCLYDGLALAWHAVYINSVNLSLGNRLQPVYINFQGSYKFCGSLFHDHQSTIFHDRLDTGLLGILANHYSVTFLWLKPTLFGISRCAQPSLDNANTTDRRSILTPRLTLGFGLINLFLSSEASHSRKN